MSPSSRRLVRVLLPLVAVVLASCTGGGEVTNRTDGAGPAAPGEQAEQPQALDVSTGIGPLPDATFTDLRDPEVEVSTTDWRGTPTVVNFWATWCAFCVEEMPALQAASEQLAGRVRFVGIDRQDPREEALVFLEETGVTYDQVASPGGEYYTTIGARGMPTTLFVDAGGVVQYRHTGPLDRDQVLSLVAEHLGVRA